MRLARHAGRQRLPTIVRVLLGASFVSDVGSGLTLPFLLIYLHQVRHVSLEVTGLLIGLLAVVGLPVGAATGALVDRLGVRTIAVLALGLNALGAASLVLAHSTASAVGPMLLFGLGSGMSWPAWFALLSVVARERDRPRLFALNFQLLNLGLGIGSVIAGLAVHVADPGSFVAIYLADAGTTIVVAVVLMLLPARTFSIVEESPASVKETPAPLPGADPPASRDEASTPSTGRGGYRQVLSDRRMRRFLVTTTVLALAGYGAINAGLVGYATTVVHVTPRTISVAFAANTAFIVAAQPLGLRVVRLMRRTTALSLVAAFFAGSWVMLWLAGFWPRSTVGDAVTVGMFVVFAAGEVLLSPVQGPLVNEFAPPELRGRYNAASTTVYSLASVVSPAVAGIMLGASLGPEYLGLLVACCVGCVFGFGWLRAILTPDEDQAPGRDRELETAPTP
ncbi:MAG: MFS transporter [Acidimicrobiales bacterium]|jgi:MFS family permease